MAFQDILASFDESDRQTAVTLADKYPSLRKFAEMGEVIQNLGPRLKQLSGADPTQNFEADPALAVTELESWRKWKATTWPEWETRATTTREALLAAEAKIQEFEQRTDTDMTPEEIRAVVEDVLSKKGVADKASVEAILNDFTDKKFQPALAQTVNNITSRFEKVYSDMTPKFSRHQQALGEELDVRTVFDYMTKNNIPDPDEAYQKVYASKFAAKKEADTQKAIQEAEARGKAEGRTEGRREASQSSGGRGQIVDGKGSVVPGPLVQRYHEKLAAKQQDGKIDAAKAPLGRGIIASEYAKNYADKKMSETAA